eukprot:6202002-Pleurochrysis_carterae.AAC.4
MRHSSSSSLSPPSLLLVAWLLVTATRGTRTASAEFIGLELPAARPASCASCPTCISATKTVPPRARYAFAAALCASRSLAPIWHGRPNAAPPPHKHGKPFLKKEDHATHR